MKEKLLTLICIMLLPMVASRAETEIGGIYYNLSETGAEVTKGSTAYSGTVDIPSSVTYNGKSYSVTSIGYRAFQGCTSLTAVTIPESVTSIGYQAFNNCSSLSAVTVPRSVTNMDSGVFYGCTGLKSASILGNITSLGWGVFGNCSSLTSFTIPESVTSIIEYAFYNCSSLTSLTSLIKNPFTTDFAAFDGVPPSATLYVPAGTESKYRALADWNRFTNIVAITNVEYDCDWTIGPGGNFADVNTAMKDSRVKDGQVLQLLPGANINENSYINKAVTIKGTGYSDTSDGYIGSVYIDCDSVTLRQLYLGNVYVRANDATIEHCRASSITGTSNYESDDATIRGCFVTGTVQSHPDNMASDWDISGNIFINTGSGNTLDYLEEATLDHNLIISYYNNNVSGVFAVGAVYYSSFTNNIFLRQTYSQGISPDATGSAEKFEYNIVSNTGTFSDWPTNITGYNNLAKLFACTGSDMTDAYYKLAAGSPAIGYANDGGNCGPWSGKYPYWINGIEPDATQWKLDPKLTTNAEQHEFASLDALMSYLLTHQLTESITVNVADATYSMEMIPNDIDLSNYSVNEVFALVQQKLSVIKAMLDYYAAYPLISINMKAPNEAIFKFYMRNCLALYSYIPAYLNYKAYEMLADGKSRAEVAQQMAVWKDELGSIKDEVLYYMQMLVSHIKTTNISILIDPDPVPDPDPIFIIDPDDLLCLRNLHTMLGGSSWTNKKWKFNGYMTQKEDFPGVTFDDEGYVVQINLENNNLRGSLNPSGWTWELGLPRLSGLYLQKNNISGNLSPWLHDTDRAGRLRALDMSYNNLTEISDTIPSSITSLNLNSQNREWFRPSGVTTDPLKIEAMSDMSPVRLYLSDKQTVVIPSLFTYDQKTQTHTAKPYIYIVNAQGLDRYGYFVPSSGNTYSISWKNEEYTEKQDAPCYIRFENPFSGSVYPAYLRYIEGDADISGYTDVVDVQTTLNYVLAGGGVSKFNRSAANTYVDNQINVQDIVCTVNIILDNKAAPEDIVATPSSTRRRLRRAEEALDTQGWLYTEQGRVMITSTQEVGCIDLELKGVSTRQVSLMLNHSQFQMIGRDTELGSRYIIFSPTGQPIPASEEVTLLAVSSQTELVAAQAASMEAQEMALAIGQPTGIAQVLGGALNATFRGDELVVTSTTDIQNISLRLYNTGGQIMLLKEEDSMPRGELRMKAPVSPGAYILEMTTRQGGRKNVKLMKR